MSTVAIGRLDWGKMCRLGNSQLPQVAILSTADLSALQPFDAQIRDSGSERLLSEYDGARFASAANFRFPPKGGSSTPAFRHKMILPKMNSFARLVRNTRV